LGGSMVQEVKLYKSVAVYYFGSADGERQRRGFNVSLGQRPRLVDSPIASAESAIHQGPKPAQCG